MFYSNGEVINDICRITGYVPYINYLINIGPVDRLHCSQITVIYVHVNILS